MAKEKENETEDKDEKGEEIVIVTDTPANLDVQPSVSMEEEEETPFSKPRPKGKVAAALEEGEREEDEEEDTRLGASEETEAEEEAKQKERASHKSRRQRRKEAENRLRTELRFLETRNDKLERTVQEMARRLDSTEKTSLEGRINQTKSLIAKAENVIAEATTNGKGAEAVEATRIRDKLRDDLKSFETQREEADEPTGQPEPPNPRVIENVKDWHKRNSWYDFRARDADSKIVRAIDDSLVEEGFDPTSDEYWQELDARIAKHLPHRVKRKGTNGHADESEEDFVEDEPEETRPPKKSAGKKQQAGLGGPMFRTGGPGRDLKTNEVYLSRERIEALKDAGVWDDPKLREKYLKRYRDYDREHGNQS